MTKRILLVDHRPDIVDLVKNILEYGGYAILARLTPYQYASEIDALHPDLVIVGLGSFVGRETLKLLKPTTIPVLALYMEPEQFTKQDELMSENITFVRSRFDIDDLLRVVEQCSLRHTSQDLSPGSFE